MGKAVRTTEKSSFILFWCLFFIYTSNIIGKTSFSAATVALINEELLTKTQAGLISGAYWFIYAAGQLVGGFLVNRISPYLCLNISIIGSALSNLLIIGADGFLPMLVIWSLGSAAQFGLWPAVLKLVSTEIVPRQRMMAMGRLAFCYCLGSILSYVFTATILAVTSWEYIFVLCGLVNVIVLPLSIFSSSRLSPALRCEEEEAVQDAGKSEKMTWRVVASSGLVFFCILMVIKAVVDNGIKSWMPPIMMETYGATPSYTSLLSVVLLVINIFGVLVSHFIYDKTKCDELKTLIILYTAIVPMIVTLLGFRSLNIYFVTILMSFITLLVYGSGQILQMNYPGRFHAYGLTATVGGIINCFAALGNVIATYGGGYIADNFGWDVMIGVWNVLLLAFVVIAVAMLPMWRKFRRKE